MIDSAHSWKENGVRDEDMEERQRDGTRETRRRRGEEARARGPVAAGGFL